MITKMRGLPILFFLFLNTEPKGTLKMADEVKSTDVQNLVRKVGGAIRSGVVDPKNLPNLLGYLMKLTQESGLAGQVKKRLVHDAFAALTAKNPQAKSFIYKHADELIDVVKWASKGGLDLASKTGGCWGLC